MLGIWLIPWAIVIVDHMGHYHWLRQYDDDAFWLGMFVGIILIVFVAPPINQVAAYRRMKDYQARKKLEARLNDESRP